MSDDGVFTPGTQASDTDYRVSCTGTGSDTNFVHWDDVFAASEAPGADEVSDEALRDPDTRLVVEIDNALASLGSDRFPPEGAAGARYVIVILGQIAGDGASTNSGIGVWVPDSLETDLNIDSHADLHMTGGARGIGVSTDDEEPAGSIRVRNFGSILTDSEGSEDNPRRDGMSIYSRGGDVEVSNEAGATIEVRGAGGRGITANSDGDDATIVVVNRGSVTTTGDILDGKRAYGVAAFVDGLNGTGRSINDAGGTIRTQGWEARGLYASACVWTGDECDPNGRGTAVAINRGSVNTAGERAAGVRARGEGIGTSARAVNESGGAIRTEGARAAGLEVGTDGANARSQAENRGSITTTGFRANGIDVWSNDSTAAPVSAEAENWGSVTTTGDRSYGVNVLSDNSAVSTVNHEGGDIVTSGAGSRGIFTGTRGTGQTASVVNHGSITTTGGGYAESGGSGARDAHGVRVNADGIGGTARATNEATGFIRAEGDGARGLYANACAWTGQACNPNGRGTAIAINRGSVTTTGDAYVRASGSRRRPGAVVAGAHGDDNLAQAINEGTIRAEGTDGRGLSAHSSDGQGGRAMIGNRASGRIETTGDGNAFGIFAWIDGEGFSAEIRNEGSVITRGLDSDGMLAVASDGGTQDAPNSVRAVNLAVGTVETEGDGSSGVGAHVGVGGSGRVDSYGTARAENHATINTGGGAEFPDEEVTAQRIMGAANGLGAGFFTWEDETEIGNAGDVTVVNTGSVTVTGESAGLAARTFGTGSATVQMTGGSVTAGAMDDSATPEDESGFGIGIFAAVHTDSTTDDPSDDTDISITVSGSTTTVTAHGGTDDPITDTLDESRGIGILAQTGDTGHMEVKVSGGATITADRAARFLGGRTTFTLDGSTLVGDVEFASLDDRMTIRDGLVDGDVHFGGGADTLVLDIGETGGINGQITGLEETRKRGTGVARVVDAALADNALTIEEGELSIAGHLDLGSQGSLTVHDGSRLSLEVGDLTADEGDHGRITAGQGVIYEDLEVNEAPELFLQLASAARDNAKAIQAVIEERPIDVLGENTRVRIQTDEGPVDASDTRLSTSNEEGSTWEIGSVLQDGQVRLAGGASLVEQRPSSRCQPLQRGTLGEDGVFTPGTQASDTDYLVACTGSGGEGDRFGWSDLFDAADASGADEFPDEARRNPDTRLILEIDDAYVDLGTDRYLPDDPQSRYRIVVNGKVRADGDWTGSGINTRVRETLSTDLNFESRADIHTTGTAQGIQASYHDEVPEGSIRLRNFGNILTEGEGTGVNPARAHGVQLWAPAGEAEFTNEAGATIETRGKGARGAVIFGVTGATLVNRGSITTTGDPSTDPDGSRIRRADAAAAFLEGLEGTTRAINEAGATIRSEGNGAYGLSATVCAHTGERCDPNANGTVIAINRGSVTNTGDTFVSSNGATRRPAGVHANLDAASGSAQAVNEATGTIRTEGEGARGLSANACAWGGTGCDPNGAGTATTINRGSVITRGEDAHGVYASSTGEGATSRATNEGSIRTEGAESSALRTWIAGASSPSSESINRASGQIETFGESAEGVFALSRVDGSEASTSTGSTNEGTVVTHGLNSDAVLAVALSGGTEAHPASVRSINRASATIETEGDGASGLNASIVVGLSESGPGRLDSFGTASAENHGTIITAGGAHAEELSRVGTILSGASGVIAHIWPWTDQTEIGNTGDVTVLNTGSVTVTGGSAGLAARTFGTGSATVNMTGGSVTSGAMDDSATPEDESRFGVGIFAVANTDSTADDPSDDTDVRITVSGAGTTVTAYGAAADDPATADWDESVGVGLFGQTGDTGHMEVEVSGGATITADRAAVFEGGRTTFTLDGSTLVGDVEFASLDDRMTIRDGLVDGDVHFGGGADTLVLDVGETGGITGRITGLEELLKRGAGVARIFDVDLADNAVAVEEGELSVSGHLNLGSQGTLTVHDSARLSVEVGDLTADAEDHGQITAGQGVIYEGIEANEAPELYLQVASDAVGNAEAIQAAIEENPIDVLGEGTRVQRQTDAGPADASETILVTANDEGTTREIGTVAQDGQVSLDEGATLVGDGTPGEPPTSKGGRSHTGMLLAGGGALIAGLIFDFLDDEETAFADWEEATAERRTTTSFGGIRSGHALEHRVRSGGLEHWTRTFTGDSPTLLEGTAGGTVRGVAIGLDARLDGGFRLGVTAMPDLSVSAGPGPASDYGSSLQGGHYSVRGGWYDSSLFADASLSQGRYRAQSLLDNPAAGGILGGEYGLSQSQVRGRAGARLGLGALRATPSLSLFSGTLRQDAYTAQSASLRAEVPGLSQRYEGWKAGLDLAPSGWLDGPRALRWRPGLHLGSTRTRSGGPARLDVRQSDKAGVLSFSSPAGVRALPRTVHSFGASLTAMQSDAWRLRLGYAGVVVDGEPIQAALARLHVRF